jgi:hypothetical protein
MALKNNWDSEGQKHDFDRNSLSPGDAAFTVTTFREGADTSKPVNITLELYWTPNEEDQQHIGKSFEYGVFLSGPNSGMTWQQLKSFAKTSGFNVSEWTTDNNMPLGNMVVGMLKMLAVRQQVIAIKIAAGKTDPKSRFLNFVKILRDDPTTGNPLTDRLPDAPVPHSVILDAMAQEAPGENKKGAVGSDTPF